MSSLFTPASRHQLRARIAFDGPTGSGKTWTMLAWARALAGPEGRIAVIDTERRSAELYSDRYQFDTLPWVPPYDPRKLAEVLRTAEAEGYDVVCCDSLTHFWKGEGGTLDIVEAAGRRMGGNSYAGWQTGTPALRLLIDTMLGLDAHFLATMRSKMEHLLVEDERGRKVPTKIGMAPEMRADIEYEFTVCLSGDLDHRWVVTKSRCEPLADAVIQPGSLPTEDAATAFLSWLQTGAPAPEPASPTRIGAVREWLNKIDGPDRSAVRSSWPVGVPELTSPDLTAAHLERVIGVVRGIAGDPPAEVAALFRESSAPDSPSADQDAPGPDGPPEPSAAPHGDPGPGSEPSGDDEPGPDPAPSAAQAELEALADEMGGDAASSDEAAARVGEAFAAEQADADAQALRARILTDVQAMSPAKVKEHLGDADQKTTGNAATLAARLVAWRWVQAGVADTETIAAVAASAK